MAEESSGLQVRIDKAEGYEPPARVAQAIEDLAQAIADEESEASDVEGFAQRGLDLGGLSAGHVTASGPLQWELCVGKTGGGAGCSLFVTSDAKFKM